MRIYFSGVVNGSYRAQNILKTISDAGIAFTYNPMTYFSLEMKNKYLRKILKFFCFIFFVPFRLILIAYSTHVFVLPMNTNMMSIVDIFVGRILNKIIIADYYISQYDTIVKDRKLVSENSLRGRFALFKDRFLLKAADIVIFLNESEADYYQKVVGVNIRREKIRIIPLCVDYKREMFISNQKDYESFNVCWWGTYIPLHGLENLIRAFSHIGNDRIKLYLFGDSNEKAKPYVSLIKSLELTDRVFINNDFHFSNGKLAPILAGTCDLAVGNFGSSDKAKTVLVNKLVDALSFGIPCLTIKTSATTELLPNNEGLIITESNPESIAFKIEECFNKRSTLNEIGMSGKKKYFDLFSPDIFRIKLLAILQE